MICARCDGDDCTYPHAVPMPNGEVWEICDDCYEEVSENEDREPRHAFGCICADCSDAELTADND